MNLTILPSVLLFRRFLEYLRGENPQLLQIIHVIVYFKSMLINCKRISGLWEVDNDKCTSKDNLDNGTMDTKKLVKTQEAKQNFV